MYNSFVYLGLCYEGCDENLYDNCGFGEWGGRELLFVCYMIVELEVVFFYCYKVMIQEVVQVGDMVLVVDISDGVVYIVQQEVVFVGIMCRVKEVVLFFVGLCGEIYVDLQNLQIMFVGVF